MSYFFDYNHDLLHYYSLYFHHYCIYCLYHHFHHQLIIMDIITSYDLISCNGNILLVAILHPCHWMIVSYLLIGPRISLSHSCQIPSCWTSRQPSQLLTIIGNSNIIFKSYYECEIFNNPDWGNSASWGKELLQLLLCSILWKATNKYCWFHCLDELKDSK